MEDNEEEDFDDHFPGNAGLGAFDDDIPMEEPEADVGEDDPSDDLGQALHNVQADCESETERLKFQKLLEDHHKLLYPDLGQALHNGRRQMVYPTRDLVNYSNLLKNTS